MSRRVVNTGAFYTYVARGIGKPAGVGAAYLAVLSYTALTIGLCGAFGYFVTIVLGDVGVDVAWEIPSAIASCSSRSWATVRRSSARCSASSWCSSSPPYRVRPRVLGDKEQRAAGRGTVAAERLLRLDRHRADVRVTISSDRAAALYGEETANPVRSIPRATYVVVISVGVFYFLAAWSPSERSASTGRTRSPLGSATISGNCCSTRRRPMSARRSWTSWVCCCAPASLPRCSPDTTRRADTCSRSVGNGWFPGDSADITAASFAVRRSLTVTGVTIVVVGASRSADPTRTRRSRPAWSVCQRSAWGCCRCSRRSRWSCFPPSR